MKSEDKNLLSLRLSAQVDQYTKNNSSKNRRPIEKSSNQKSCKEILSCGYNCKFHSESWIASDLKGGSYDNFKQPQNP